jgi:hypothetical protein
MGGALIYQFNSQVLPYCIISLGRESLSVEYTRPGQSSSGTREASTTSASTVALGRTVTLEGSAKRH